MLNRNAALLILIVVAIFSGGNPVFVKLGLKEIPPFSFLFLRCLLSFLVLLPFVYKELVTVKKSRLFLTTVSLLACANVILFNFAIPYTSAIESQLIYGGTPLITAFVTAYLLRQRITFKKLFGIILGLAGVVSVIIQPVLQNNKEFIFSPLPNLIIFIGAVCYALHTIFSQKLQEKFSPVLITSWFIFLTAVLVLPMTVREVLLDFGWWNTISPLAWGFLLYVGLLGTLALYLLIQYALKYSNAVFVSMLSYLGPIATTVWAYFLLGERLTFAIVAGGIVALTGVWITTHEK